MRIKGACVEMLRILSRNVLNEQTVNILFVVSYDYVLRQRTCHGKNYTNEKQTATFYIRGPGHVPYRHTRTHNHPMRCVTTSRASAQRLAADSLSASK